MIYKSFLKRFLDIVFSLIFLIFFGWIIIIVAILVKIKLGSPIFFKQVRIGRDEKEFTIYKFRTMTNEKDDSGKLLKDEMRLTKFGRLLRSTSLDELPEIFNILSGEMTLIGPRPLLKDYLGYYTERERLRHTVIPGLTGYAQVNGRNTTPWDIRLEQDVYYVENMSFLLDLKILLKTVSKVIMRSDIRVGFEHGVKGNRLDIVRKNGKT